MTWNRILYLSRSKLAPWNYHRCVVHRQLPLAASLSPHRFLSSSSSSHEGADGSNKNNNNVNIIINNNNNQRVNNGENSSLDETRTSILTAALQEVHQYGWTEDALAAAVAISEKSGSTKSMSMSVAGMITTDDMIAFCMDQWNVQLKHDLQKGRQQHFSEETTSEPMDQLLMRGLRTRLEYLIPYLESNRWHEGMAMGVRGPSNAMQTQQQLREMIDIIVDSSSSVLSDNLCTSERMALGAVYVATELHLLTDSSTGYQDTWNFLESRMVDWRKFVALASALPSLGSRQFGASHQGGTIHNNSSSMGVQDSLFVVSSVASSLAGGLVSLVVNPKPSGAASATFGLPDVVWQSLFQGPQNLPGSVPGSNPSHYDVPTPPSPSNTARHGSSSTKAA